MKSSGGKKRQSKGVVAAKAGLSPVAAAKLCDVSRQTIHAWQREEGLKKRPTAADLCKFLAHRTGHAPGSQRERLAGAQAEKAELDVQQRKGNLIDAAAATQAVQALAIVYARAMKNLGIRVANTIPDVSTFEVRARIIRQEYGLAYDQVVQTINPEGAGQFELVIDEVPGFRNFQNWTPELVEEYRASVIRRAGADPLAQIETYWRDFEDAEKLPAVDGGIASKCHQRGELAPQPIWRVAAPASSADGSSVAKDPTK